MCSMWFRCFFLYLFENVSICVRCVFEMVSIYVYMYTRNLYQGMYTRHMTHIWISSESRPPYIEYEHAFTEYWLFSKARSIDARVPQRRRHSDSLSARSPLRPSSHSTKLNYDSRSIKRNDSNDRTESSWVDGCRFGTGWVHSDDRVVEHKHFNNKN